MDRGAVDIASEVRAGTSLGVNLKKRFDAIAVGEALCVARKWPRCPNAGDGKHPLEGKHPLAYDPPIETGCCPECGAPSLPPEEPVIAVGVWTDGHWLTAFGRLLMRVGEFFGWLSERMKR